MDTRGAGSAGSLPLLAGVINVTPDSFSDGGACLAPERAVEHALGLIAQGAAWLDVGGESTRPGARPVEARLECARVLPVIAALAGRVNVPISIDTSKAEVAAQALDAGASVVNDISAGRADADMLSLVARRSCGLVLMHMQGTPADMQRAPHYGDVLAEVGDFLAGRIDACRSAGIAAERLWVDPGIGFGKTLAHNLALLRGLASLCRLGPPLFVGVSRKSFIAALNAAGGQPGGAPAERLGGTLAAALHCARAGAAVLRVHDVGALAEALRVQRALD